MTLHRLVNLLARLLSLMFKLSGIACVAIGVLVARNIAEQPGRGTLGLEYLPDAYLVLIFVLAFLVPFLGGVILFGVSFLLDIWIMLRQLKSAYNTGSFLVMFRSLHHVRTTTGHV